MEFFYYFEDGTEVTSFEGLMADDRYGTDPDRFLTQIRQAGMETDSPPDDEDCASLNDTPDITMCLLTLLTLGPRSATPVGDHHRPVVADAARRRSAMTAIRSASSGGVRGHGLRRGVHGQAGLIAVRSTGDRLGRVGGEILVGGSRGTKRGPFGVLRCSRSTR